MKKLKNKEQKSLNLDIDIQNKLKELGLFKKNKLEKNIIIGELYINSRQIGFIKAINLKLKKDLRVDKKYLKKACYKDLVVAYLLPGFKAKIIAVLKPNNSTRVVQTKLYGEHILGLDIKTKDVINLKASQKSLKKLGLDMLLKTKQNGEILEFIGHIDDASCDVGVVLAMYDKTDYFSKEVLAELKAYDGELDVNLYPNRVDLRKLDFCTIDPSDAKDFDDALYFDEKNLCLYVAIADVSAYVPCFSMVDEEARKRGFSIYFPNHCVPMLPAKLSENLCSLLPNKDRLAFCFKLSFDEDLKLVKEELFEAIICSKKRFSYEQVDALFGGENSWSKRLDSLLKLSFNLKEKRMQNALFFENKDLKLILDENKELKASFYEDQSLSHQLVEECMLLANKAAAKKIKYGIFRTHKEANFLKIKLLYEKLLSLGIEAGYKNELLAELKNIQEKARLLKLKPLVDKLIIKSQQRAIYQSYPGEHYALGFKSYSHFTSPIRRYSDLYLHRLLKAKTKKEYDFLLKQNEELCSQLSIKERECSKIEQDLKARKFAHWAKKNKNKPFKAIAFEDYAVLDDELCGPRLELSLKKCSLFESIDISICDVSLQDCKIKAKQLFGKYPLKRRANV